MLCDNLFLIAPSSACAADTWFNAVSRIAIESPAKACVATLTLMRWSPESALLLDSCRLTFSVNVSPFVAV